MSESNFIIGYKEAELSDDMANERRSDAWGGLIAVHKQFASDDNFMAALKVEEDKYMEDMYGDIPEAKKSNGDWKYRKFKFTSDGVDQLGGLPMAYMSAKSTIKQARENSVKIVEKGKIIAKDKITKALAAAKDETTPYQKALNHVKRLEGIWGNLDPTERGAIKEAVASL